MSGTPARNTTRAARDTMRAARAQQRAFIAEFNAVNKAPMKMALARGRSLSRLNLDDPAVLDMLEAEQRAQIEAWDRRLAFNATTQQRQDRIGLRNKLIDFHAARVVAATERLERFETKAARYADLVTQARQDLDALTVELRESGAIGAAALEAGLARVRARAREAGEADTAEGVSAGGQGSGAASRPVSSRPSRVDARRRARRGDAT